MRKMRLEVIAVVSLGLMFPFASGCGEDAAENMVERAIESAAEKKGEKVDVDVSDGTVTIRSKEGAATFKADDDRVAMKTDEGSVRIGAGTPLPKSFPKDVPVYAGSKVVQSVDMGKMVMATLETSDPFGKAVASYEKECPGNGWEQVGSVTGSSGDPVRVLNYRKDERSLIVSITRDRGKKKTVISLTASDT
jgi:hypothetical protein